MAHTLTRQAIPDGPGVPRASAPCGAGAEAARRRKDRAARWTVTAGGLAIILTIGGMLLFIVAQVAPLWYPARAGHVGTGALPESGAAGALAAAMDEYGEHVVVVYGDGRVDAVRWSDGRVAARWTATGLEETGGTGAAGETGAAGGTGAAAATSATTGPPIVAADLHPERDLFTLAMGDGRAVPLEVHFAISYEGGQRSITPSLRALDPVPLAPEGQPLRAAVYRPLRDGWIAVGITDDGRVFMRAQEQSRALLGPARPRETAVELTADMEGREPTAVTVDPSGQYVLVGDGDGGITAWHVRTRSRPERIGRVDAGDAPVTVLTFLIGGRSLVAGTADGRVTRWLPVAEDGVPGGRQFRPVNEFARHGAPVVAAGVSRRTKGFATLDADGNWALHHGTTGRTQLFIETDLARADTAAFAPRGNGIVVVGPQGQVDRWSIRNPHPEVSLGVLFGKVWYEGYDEPAYVWQSTGGRDDFEPKMSLTPLLYGTVKGTVYALLFAVPLAILGAVYASQLMDARWRGVIKPVVEMMAGLPSVVLGFLAGLWLAPWLERNVPGVLAMAVLVPATLLTTAIVWGKLPPAWQNRLPAGRTVVAALPLAALAAWGALALGPVIERGLMGGDFRQWLFEVAGVRFDQRNSLVVGFAMGFAVIPVIFSIAEDGLSSVPDHLVSGSLALGATQWETIRRVVLPAASPAMFSAIMIGFGRAVGETMIVLMATGNTPVMDMGLFTGFRALAANVAVEMPEAPVGGTLYRVLFLSALLLFAVTFLVNTAAELVRLRLRRRYGQL